jgi:hypothetical protein
LFFFAIEKKTHTHTHIVNFSHKKNHKHQPIHAHTGSETSYGATPTTLPSVAPDVDVGARVLSIVVSAHTCALVAVTGVSQGGALRCWGPNDEGQCGYGHVRPIGATRDSVPRLVGDVPIGDFVRQVDVGLYHTCVVTLQYTLRCWGSNIYGQLGYGRAGNVGETPETTPARVGDVPMPRGLKVMRVATGAWHTCVLLSDHSVRCWGRGHGLTGPAGAIGYGDEATRGEKGYINVAPRDLPPIPLGAGVRVGAVRCGRAHTWYNKLLHCIYLFYVYLFVCVFIFLFLFYFYLIFLFIYLFFSVLLLDDASSSHDDPNAHGRIQCWGWGLFGALGYGNPQSIGDTPARLPERFGAVRVEAVRADPSLVTDASSELAGLAPMRDGWPLDVAGDSIIGRVYLLLPIALVVVLALYVAARVARGDSLARIFTQRRSQSKFE